MTDPTAFDSEDIAGRKAGEYGCIEDFYEYTYLAYANPGAVRNYIDRIPATRQEGLRVPLQEFKELLPPGGSILDVGSGPGNDVHSLRTLGYRAFGVDSSPAMVKVAADMYGDFFRIGDVRSLERATVGVFNGVICIALLLHVMRGDAAKVVQRLHDVTRPGGALLIVTKEGRQATLDWQLGGPHPRGVVLYSDEELVALLMAAGYCVRTVYHNRSQRGDASEQWISILATVSDASPG